MKIEMYMKENGNSPIYDFILSLNDNLKAKAVREIDILAKFGRELREPYVKALKGAENKGLYELRIRFSTDSARIFYFIISNDNIILLNGFIKKSNKTPQNEIALARKYKADYERRFIK